MHIRKQDKPCLLYTSVQTVEQRVDNALDISDEELHSRLETGSSTNAAVWQELRLKEDDTLQGITGTNVLLLAGRMQVTYSSGAVVDATSGSVVPSGTVLTVGHRYILSLIHICQELVP